MCYFLYGAINAGINIDDYSKIMQNSGYDFTVGDKKDVNLCVKNCSHEYRITYNHCDCDTPVGMKDSKKEGLSDFAELLKGLKAVRGIKHILLSKNFTGDINETEKMIHIDEIDVCQFLANVEDNCLYKIELFKRYY